MRLTTEEAVKILGVSKPTLVKLLGGEKILYEKPSRHRYIKLEDLEAYRRQVTGKQRRAIRELTHTGMENPVAPDPDGVAQTPGVTRKEIPKDDLPCPLRREYPRADDTH